MEYTPSRKPIRIVQGKASRWWTTPLVHLVPIGLTAVLLWLSYSTKYWFPESGLHTRLFGAKANNVLNWLQLAAKLYEIVVVASMAAITLKAFKRIFVDTGIPFGLLSGAYRVGDVFYLVNSGFWRALLFDNSRNFKVVALSTLLVVNTLLSILVGPASAILIVPNLDWFPLPDAFSQVTMPIFYYAHRDYLWPSVLNETFWTNDTAANVTPSCRLERGALIYECPASGFSDIYTWAAGWQYSGLPDNITFEDQSGSVSRRLDMRNHNDSGTFVTTPTALAAKTFGQFKYYVRSKNVGAISSTARWKLTYAKSSQNLQPLVQAKCNIWNTQTTVKEAIQKMAFPSSELECFSEGAGGGCHQIRDDVATWTISADMTTDKDQVLYGWNTTDSDPNMEAGSPSSLMFIAGMPYLMDDQVRGVRVVGCSYMAHWVPSTPGIDPSNTDYIETNITDLDVFFDNKDKHGRPVAVGSVISLQKDWLPYLDVSLSDDGVKNASQVDAESLMVKVADQSYSVGTMLAAMMMTNTTGTNDIFGPGSDLAGEKGDERVRQVMEKFTGALVADAIARATAGTSAYLILGNSTCKDSAGDEKVDLDQLFIQEGPNSRDLELFQNGSNRYPGGPLYQIPDFSWRTMSDLTAELREKLVTVDFEAERYGYGFGQPGPPMRFALTVIIFYLGILVAYAVCVFIWGGKTVAPWDDLQDLLALAWISASPPELKGQGAKIADKGLWQENVSVKARQDDHVSLVLGDDHPGMNKLKNGESYY